MGSSAPSGGGRGVPVRPSDCEDAGITCTGRWQMQCLQPSICLRCQAAASWFQQAKTFAGVLMLWIDLPGDGHPEASKGAGCTDQVARPWNALCSTETKRRVPQLAHSTQA